MSLILAVGLGKFNSVLCLYDTVIRVASFRTVNDNADDSLASGLRERAGA